MPAAARAPSLWTSGSRGSAVGRPARRVRQQRRTQRPATAAGGQRRQRGGQADQPMGCLQRPGRSGAKRAAAPTGLRLHRAGQLHRRRRGEERPCCSPSTIAPTAPRANRRRPSWCGHATGRHGAQRILAHRETDRHSGHLSRSLGAAPVVRRAGAKQRAGGTGPARHGAAESRLYPRYRAD